MNNACQSPDVCVHSSQHTCVHASSLTYFLLSKLWGPKLTEANGPVQREEADKEVNQPGLDHYIQEAVPREKKLYANYRVEEVPQEKETLHQMLKDG